MWHIKNLLSVDESGSCGCIKQQRCIIWVFLETLLNISFPTALGYVKGCYSTYFLLLLLSASDLAPPSFLRLLATLASNALTLTTDSRVEMTLQCFSD